MATSATTYAQVLDEIVVTATKREATIQDVPLSVSAINSVAIEKRGLLDFSDYLSSLPGVAMQDNGPGRNSIKVRGVSSGNEFKTPPTVATYLGDIPLTTTGRQINGNPNVRLIDIERIEVLRGPQGTLYGANALGGAVKTIPNKPNLEKLEGQFSGTFSQTQDSDDDNRHVTGAISLPVIEGVLGVRLAAYDIQNSGFIDNDYAGFPGVDASFLDPSIPPGVATTPAISPRQEKDIAREDTSGGRIIASWQASDSLLIHATHVTQESEANGLPEAVPSIGKLKQDRFFGEALKDDLDVTNIVVSYDFSTASLVSSTSYMERETLQDRDAKVYFDGLFPLSLTDRSKDEVLVQEVRLESSSDSNLQWIVGAFYSNTEQTSTQLLADSSEFAAGVRELFDSVVDYEETQRAVFGEVTFDINDKVSLGVGLRAFNVDLNISDTSSGPLGSGATVRGGGDSDELNGKIHLTYMANEDHTLYAQAAQGFRSGVVNSPIPSGVGCEAEIANLTSQGVMAGALAEPDTLWNYELGSKSSYAEGRVRLNAALYYIDWQDIQTSFSFGCGFDTVTNGGEATSQGVELELSAALTDNLMLDFSASYTDAEFDNAIPALDIAAGERAPGVPRSNFALGLQYAFSVAEDIDGFARLDYTHVSDYETALTSIDSLRAGDYDLVNIRLGIQSNGLEGELFINNLGDEDAVLDGTPETSSLGARSFLLRPQTVGVTLRYRF